ncbi:hypothetical protein [Sphingomonas adhaesiva]|uniref:hypothetical protein n=1 Tax=Sphingomonas adhaesiva TaxID=28212 RepID=UPI002FF63823
MTPREPLALYHSWPLWERGCRLDLGRVHDGAPPLPVGDMRMPDDGDAIVGVWRCDLRSGRLDWSPEVHRLFDVAPDRAPQRDGALAVYTEESRSAMERLRDHALRHHRGFTLDVALRIAGDRRRWMRITAAPQLEDGRPVVLHGTKQDVTAAYR